MSDVTNNTKKKCNISLYMCFALSKVVSFSFKYMFSNNQAALNTILNNQKCSKPTLNSV